MPIYICIGLRRTCHLQNSTCEQNLCREELMTKLTKMNLIEFEGEGAIFIW